MITTWRHALYALLLATIILATAYWRTAVSIVALWSMDPLGHGYFVIPAAAYLTWNRRLDLQRATPGAALSLCPVLVLLTVFWFVGRITETNIVQQVSLISMFICVVCGVLGFSIARILTFPLGFLFFMLPVGVELVPVLQQVTARAAVTLLAWSGYPVLLQGNLISMPGGEWKVAEACSGINYLTASLAIGCLYVGIAYRAWKHRVGFIAAAALVPLLANALRVYGTILIASVGGIQIAAGAKHYAFGWLVFAVMIAILFVTCGQWSEDLIEDSRPLPAAGALLRKPALFVMVAIPVFAWAPIAAKVYERSLLSGPARPNLLSTAPLSSDWTAVDASAFSWRPRFDTPASESLTTYERQGRYVKLYVAFYGGNQRGVKLVSGNTVLFDDPWTIIEQRTRSVTIDQHLLPVQETRLGYSSSRLVIWHWYWVEGAFTGNDYMAKLNLAKARLVHSPRGSAAIAVSASSRIGIDAEATLADFVATLSLSRFLKTLE